MESCIYEGQVIHHRRAPVRHRFGFRFFWMYLDLEELPGLFRGRLLWSVGRRNLASFHRADYLGDPAVPLDQAVRDLVESRTGTRPGGPIRLLTQIRYAGYVFNPVSFYYCFDQEGSEVVAIVAEITNTPWGQRFTYVMTRRAAAETQGMMRFVFEKEFHVSPFMGMDQQYDWRFSEPGERLSVKMDNLERDGKIFDASMTLRRLEIGTASLAKMLVRYPFMTLQIITAIHWQALLLWLRGAGFHPHPERSGSAAVEVKK